MFYPTTSLVTLISLLVYFWMATQVARTRRNVGIPAPAMAGDERLERTIRAHVNTLEWMPIFLPALWLFAVYWGDGPPAVLGAVWAIGRVIYFLGYVRSTAGRRPGFLIQVAAVTVLVLGSPGRVVWLLVNGSGL
ncbi:MAPEG family protein [Micromonospora sp. STR1s_5]|nr:MAPEG family protein [Micromonospora sp. STR1s_5]